MAAALPIGPSISGLLGGAQGALWSLFGIRTGIIKTVHPTADLPEPSTGNKAARGLMSLTKSSASRWRRLTQALGKQLTDTFLDLIGETVKDVVLYPGAALMLSDAIAYWVYSDLLVKTTYDSTLHVPTAETFSKALNYILDTVAALLLTDIVSNRDVGSDIAEGVIDSFNQAVVGDSIRAYIETIAGVEAVDDDEIRDIVGDGAAQTPEELGYLGARSGLDTFSAIAELYTGLLQGDNPYWSRAVKEVEDNIKRLERGLAPDIYVLGSLMERLSEDIADSAYWYLEVVDYIINRIKTIVRDAGQLLATVMSGGISPDDAVTIIDQYNNELLALEAQVAALEDPEYIDSKISDVLNDVLAVINSVDMNKVYAKIEVLLDDVGRRMADHVNTAAKAYSKLKQIRTIRVL